MSLFNYKQQSFLSSLFFKPFNNLLSYFSAFLKPKKITKKDDDIKSYKSNSEMKIISTFPREPKNPTILEQAKYLREEVADLHRKMDFFKSEQDLIRKKRAQEKLASTPREERSFVARIFSR